MLGWAGSQVLRQQDFNLGDMARQEGNVRGGTLQPIGLSDVEGSLIPERTDDYGEEPDGDCHPQIGPRVAFQVSMPEHEADVSDAEEKVRIVEGLVETVSNPGDGKHNNAEQDC